MIDVNKAKERSCKFLLEILVASEKRRKFINLHTDLDIPFGAGQSMDNFEDEKIQDEYEDLSSDIDNLEFSQQVYMQKIAALEEFKDHIYWWMIDICGTATGDTDSPISLDGDGEDGQSFMKGISDYAGSGFSEVRSLIESNDFTITDSGSGGGHWHIGVPCDDDMADSLIKIVREAYGDFIELGVMHFRKIFWHFKFWEFSNPHAALEYARKHDIEIPEELIN